MRRRARGRAGAAASVVLVVLAAACSGGGGPAGVPTTVPASQTGPGPLYISVGASETTGIGSEVPLREAWPRVLYRTAMPANTVFVNMGIPGATVALALQFEVPRTVDQKPNIVTVWLNVNDIIAGVSAADFERDLGNLVRQLRRGGQTRVLVANTPPIDHLPAYKACRPDPPAAGPECRAPNGVLPAPDDVNRLIDDYNAATARVAEREGANLVDLHAVGMKSRAAGIEDALVSPDGFHPNAGGYQLVATAFAEVLQKSGPL
ncbi:MAG: SGNH/GDSL hydrolase family protein [Acidimicrobiales bacterium]